MLEVLGKHLVTEFINLSNNESITFLIPADDIVKSWIVHDIICFNQKRWNVCVQVSATIFRKHWVDGLGWLD